MIALRLALCAFILIAAALWYGSFAAALDGAIESYETVVRFISFVRSEIAFYETPFPGIVRKFAELEALEPTAFDEVGGDGALVERVGKALGSLPDEKDAARFASFYYSVGGGFFETELRSCDGAASYFTERAAAVREEYARRKKASGALTLFCASSVCLLVL